MFPRQQRIPQRWRLSWRGWHSSEHARIPDLAQAGALEDFLRIRAVRKSLEISVKAILLSNENFLWVVTKEVEEVRVVRCGDYLHGLSFFTYALGIGKAVQSILHVSQKSRMKAAVWLLQTDHRGRLREIGQAEHGK